VWLIVCRRKHPVVTNRAATWSTHGGWNRIILGNRSCHSAVSSLLTLKTNISRLKKATVLKLPSQMLGLPFPGSAGRSPDGRAGRECLRSEVEWVRRDGNVGNGRVGSSMAVGMPEVTQQHESLHYESQGYELWWWVSNKILSGNNMQEHNKRREKVIITWASGCVKVPQPATWEQDEMHICCFVFLVSWISLFLWMFYWFLQWFFLSPYFFLPLWLFSFSGLPVYPNCGVFCLCVSYFIRLSCFASL